MKQLFPIKPGPKLALLCVSIFSFIHSGSFYQQYNTAFETAQSLYAYNRYNTRAIPILYS